MTTQAELIAEHKARLGAAATKFDAPDDADFARHLYAAAMALNTSRPRLLSGEITGVAYQANYVGPAGLVRVHRLLWGSYRAHRQWEPGYVGVPPRVLASWDGTQPVLVFTPPPTAAQLTNWGATIDFIYVAAHQLDATTNTINPLDNNLLLLRAAAEAMGELANAGVVSPVQLHRGMVAIPSNSTPQAVYAQLMAEYEKQAAAA